MVKQIRCDGFAMDSRGLGRLEGGFDERLN
jgi:hypothetical protein